MVITEAIKVIQVQALCGGAPCRRPSQLSQSAARPAAPRSGVPEFRLSPAVRTRIARPRAARAERARCRQPGRNPPPPIFCRARLRRRAIAPASPRARLRPSRPWSLWRWPRRRPARDPTRRGVFPPGFGRDREPEAKPRQAVGLAEGTQHDDAAFGGVRDGAGAGLKKIDEGFVDNQQAAVFAKNRRQRVQIRRRDEPSIRIVGIDDDGDIFVFEPGRGLRRRSVPRRWRPSSARARHR